MEKLTEQEYDLREREEKCVMVAQNNGIKFSGDISEMTPGLKSFFKESKKIKSEKELIDKQIQHTKLEQILTIKKGDMHSKENKRRIKELRTKIQELRDKMGEASEVCVQRNSEIADLMEKSALKTGRTRMDYMDQSEDYQQDSKRQKKT